MKKVVITGAKGKIGSVLMDGLRDGYELFPADLPEIDVLDYGALFRFLAGKDAVIHLAWTSKETWESKEIDPDNTEMYENVYKAAIENEVRRVIMASSVHADGYMEWNSPEKISIDRDPKPTDEYGWHKLDMENTGRGYAMGGLEVVCIRFGGVVRKGEVPWDDIPSVGLTHNDCTEAVRACLNAGSVPGNFAVFYAVSENPGKRIHDYLNPFGWKPRDDAASFYY